jgi:hypothetical protein
VPGSWALSDPWCGMEVILGSLNRVLISAACHLQYVFGRPPPRTSKATVRETMCQSVRPWAAKPGTLGSVMSDESYIVIVKQGPIFDGLLFAVGGREQKEEMKGTGRSWVGS